MGRATGRGSSRVGPSSPNQGVSTRSQAGGAEACGTGRVCSAASKAWAGLQRGSTACQGSRLCVPIAHTRGLVLIVGSRPRLHVACKCKQPKGAQGCVRGMKGRGLHT